MSSKSNVVYLIFPTSGKHNNFSIANSQDGSSKMVKKIPSAAISYSLGTVVIDLLMVLKNGLVALISPFFGHLNRYNGLHIKERHPALSGLR